MRYIKFGLIAAATIGVVALYRDLSGLALATADRTVKLLARVDNIDDMVRTHDGNILYIEQYLASRDPIVVSDFGAEVDKQEMYNQLVSAGMDPDIASTLVTLGHGYVAVTAT